MVLTPSNMIPLGTKAPNFKLLDVVTDELVTLKDIESDVGTVAIFICNHCPYVQHILAPLITLAKEYIIKGLSFVAINSNDTKAYPEDSPKKMKALAEKYDFPFPYLFDETQEIARAYGATCTPDFFVFDETLECVYRGQFDDSRPESDIPPTGQDLADALDSLLSGEEVSPEQRPSIGCNIKWRSNTPKSR